MESVGRFRVVGGWRGRQLEGMLERIDKRANSQTSTCKTTSSGVVVSGKGTSLVKSSHN